MSDHHIAIIGSGFSGMGMAIRLLQEGKTDFVVLERADDVGGTWQANRYPGCQCDIPSHLYSFSFALNPNWSRTYSKQQEIWDYMRRVAEDYGVMPYIRLNHEVTGAEWDEDQQHWRIETSQGELTADILVAGPGGLSEPSIPSIPGLESFQGPAFHTAEWHDDHDLTGERVAVIGTGASSVQVVPNIQPQVGRLKVFMRTPPWIVPHSDRPITSLERRLYRRVPAAQRLVRSMVYWMHEAMVFGLVHKPARLKLLEKAAKRHRESQLSDPELRRRLTPDYRLGCKRILPSNLFYPALRGDQRRPGHRRHPRDPGRRDRDRGRRAPRGGHDRPRDGLPRYRHQGGRVHPRPRAGPRSRSSGARARGPTSAWPWPAFPTCSS